MYQTNTFLLGLGTGIVGMASIVLWGEWQLPIKALAIACFTVTIAAGISGKLPHYKEPHASNEHDDKTEGEQTTSDRDEESKDCRGRIFVKSADEAQGQHQGPDGKPTTKDALNQFFRIIHPREHRL